MRVRIIKDYKSYKQGETLEVTSNIAHGLIDGGIAVLTKDMVGSDIMTKDGLKTAVNKRGKHGNLA